MQRIAGKTFVACVSSVVLAASLAAAQPQRVPLWAERILDEASYVQLAKEWKDYIQSNGESPEALVNLGTAYYYSHEKKAAMVAAERGVEIGPDNADALGFLGKMLSMYGDDPTRATELLERCIAIAPDHYQGLTSLAALYQKNGKLEESEAVFETMFEQHIFPTPLEDYAYNMLVGLPDGVVLVTNGDADTFPPLALQAGMQFRPDVAIANWHLLSLPSYARALLERYPAAKPKGGIPDGEGPEFARKLLERMVADPDIVVYFAASVAFQDLGLALDRNLEGINHRSAPGGLTPEESARLLLDRYRMDSATAWDYAWDLTPSVRRMMANYGSCVVQLVYNGGLTEPTKQRLLEVGSNIAEFHDMERLSYIIGSMEKRGGKADGNE
jgi:tetratricopeptide (TPR) repeat protein